MQHLCIADIEISLLLSISTFSCMHGSKRATIDSAIHIILDVIIVLVFVQHNHTVSLVDVE